MNSSDDLFLLIKSMSVNEKRHFKLFSSLQAGEKKYLHLFDLIAAQDEYNESVIIKQFTTNKNSTNFSVTKAYLLENILNSLEVFHSKDSMEAQLRKQINCIKILSAKKQYTLCLKQIAKAKRLALEFDFYTCAYDLFVIEESVMLNRNDIKWLEKNVERIYKEQNRTVEKLKNFQEYRKLSTLSTIRGTKQERMRSRQKRRNTSVIQKPKLLQHSSTAISDRALISYYFMNGAECYYRNDNAGSLQYFFRLKNFIEKKKQYKKLYYYSYLYALNNIISAGVTLLKFEEMMNMLATLKTLRNSSVADNANIQLRYYMQLTNVLVHYGSIEKAIETIPEVESWLQSSSKYALHSFHRNTLLINIAIIYFIAGDFKSCSNYINAILNNELKGLALDKYGFTRLLNLIVHFELRNLDLLSSITKSTYRYFYKHNRLYKFETLVLDFIRNKTPHIDTKAKQIAAFIELKSAFEKLMKDPKEKSALGGFDIITWIDSKIEHRTFAQLLREKAQNKK